MTRYRALNIGFALLPIVVSMLITALLIIAVGQNPLDVVSVVWQGGFASNTSIADSLNLWIPLALASVALVVTFTAGLWNIGVEGQMMMGAIFASWAARTLNFPSPVLIGAELVLAALGGMAVGLLIGFLKTRFAINEIFSGVAINALVNVYSIYLISGPWRAPEGGNVQSTPTFPQAAWIPALSTDFSVSLFMLVLVIVITVLVALALRTTRWGLQLKATGKNPRSALLLGVPTVRTTLSAFLVCGAIAGIAGSYRVLFTFHSLRPLASGGIGFLGLLIVLLVSMRVAWTPFIALIFAGILAGSSRMQSRLQLDQSLAGVVQGLLVLVVLLFNGIRQRLPESWRGTSEEIQNE
ncbi:MAG: ABC transporter permease [Anaerolineae bacterium]